MKMKIDLGRLCLVLVLLFVLLNLSFGPSEWGAAPSKYWLDNAAADGASSGWNWGYQPAPGYPPPCYRNGGCESLSIHYQPNRTAAENSNPLTGDVFMNFSNPPYQSPIECDGYYDLWSYYCKTSGSLGPDGHWTSCDCEVWGFAVIPENRTGDQGGPTQCANLREADGPNMEGNVGESPDNYIVGNSSIDLKSGNVYHSQQVGPLTFSYNSVDSSNGPLGTGWTHDFNISIIPNSDGSLFLRRFDGNSVWFVPGTGNSYYADAKSRDTSSIVKNADGSYTRTTKFGQVYNFDGSGRLTGIVDRNGNATTLTYTGSDLSGITDPTGRTIGISVSGGKIVSVTEFSGEVSTISYSQAGLISSIAGPLGNTWHFQYDSSNKMVEKTDPSNNVVSYTYDATTGRLLSTTDPNNVPKSVAYDSANWISTITEKDGGVWTHQYYAGFNVPLAITDPYGNKTTYTYDSNNNLLSIKYPDGTSKAYTYDANRNVTSVKDAAGRTTTLTYNSQNRVTDILDPAGGTTHFTYDANGNLTSSKDPTGAVTQIQRDSKGNITSVTDPLGHTVQFGYDQYNNVTSVTDPTNVAMNLTRDILGNVLTLKDALNNTTSFTYDVAGHLTAAADPLGNTVSLTHDKNGNSNSVTDPQLNLTTYSYDYKGRPTQKVDALGKITAFSYTATGCPSCGGGGEKLTSLTDAAGSTTSFSYDQRGFLTSITDPLQKTTSLTYDVNGRPKTRTDRNGTALTYAYTPAGNLSSITYPDQSRVTNTFDSLDRLTQLNDPLGTSTFTYDAAGRITSFTDPNGFTLSYTYDAAGNITQVTYPDSTSVTYAYDAANRLVSVTNWLNEQATYGYDQAGRLSTFTQFNAIATTYTYDAASRLTGMAGSISSFQFTLDGNGNRIHSTESQPISATASNGVSAVYTYNAQKERLLSAGPLSYTYDNEGQLTNSGNTGLTFDFNHRLVAIGSDTQFSYDARGNRLSATRAGVTTHYVYDPWGNLIAEADSANNITRKYIYGKGLLASVTSAGRYCYHFNGTGSTVAITDTTGTVVNSYAYDPFGQILVQQETVAQPFKYVGQYGVIAEPNGLYYMRARYYDPSVGRFISEDPLGFDGGDVNLFAYVSNDPVNRIDPYGLTSDTYPWVRYIPWVLPAIPAIVNPGTVAVAVGGGIILYPSDIAEEPPIPIPVSPAKPCDDTKRCEKALKSCRDDCISIYTNNPDWLPGTGTDMKGRVRRCIRDCMKANGCYNY